MSKTNLLIPFLFCIYSCTPIFNSKKNTFHRGPSSDSRNSLASGSNMLGNHGHSRQVDNPEPGQLYFIISLPHVNSMIYKPDTVSRSRSKTGFFGASLGLDYYYRQNKFLRFSVAAVTTFPIPFPAPFDFSGDMETMSSEYLTITNNYQLNRFLLGYGLSFARNSWRYFNNTTDPILYYGKENKAALGIVLQSYYRLGRKFYLGAIYRPTFLRFPSNHSLQYEHLISLDLSWRIRL
jgi:hypothetical protein